MSTPTAKERRQRGEKMLERFPIRPASTMEWSRVGSFVRKHQEQLEQAHSLAEVYEILCLDRFGRPMGNQWLSQCLVAMFVRKISCAGYRPVTHAQTVRLEPIAETVSPDH